MCLKRHTLNERDRDKQWRRDTVRETEVKAEPEKDRYLKIIQILKKNGITY